RARDPHAGRRIDPRHRARPGGPRVARQRDPGKGRALLRALAARENHDYRRTSALVEPASAPASLNALNAVRPFASVLFAARSEVAMHELNCHRALAYR